MKSPHIEIIEWLMSYFPCAFFKSPKEIKPLKIGIFDDIIDFYERLTNPPYTKKQLRDALHYYSGSTAYLKQQAQGAMRIDLYGNEVDPVNAEQAEYALGRLKTRQTPKNK